MIFFSNPKVSKNDLLQPHFKKTVERIELVDTDYILSIQDSVVLNYTSHKAKTEIGRIGRTGKTEQYGLIQHNTLCVTMKNEPLGLLDLQHFHGDDFDVTVHRDQRVLENKQNICWINASRNRRYLLKNISKKVITVADRQGDFFEFLHDLHVNKESFVIRAAHNRNTGQIYKDGGKKLFDLVGKQNDKGVINTFINDVVTREIKEITLKIKCLDGVYFPLPHHFGKMKDNYQPLQVNIVMAYNEDYCWKLLTDLPINTLEDCQRIISIYKARWHIEDYHKILKTGYQIDELYLHASRDTLENALTMISMSACRLYWMIYVGRVEKTIKADCLFEVYEWKCLYTYFKEEIPIEVPSLAEIIIKIARLGGYKVYKNVGPPGIKTMWLGFQNFTIAAQMYRNMLSIKT